MAAREDKEPKAAMEAMEAAEAGLPDIGLLPVWAGTVVMAEMVFSTEVAAAMAAWVAVEAMTPLPTAYMQAGSLAFQGKAEMAALGVMEEMAARAVIQAGAESLAALAALVAKAEMAAKAAWPFTTDRGARCSMTHRERYS